MSWWGVLHCWADFARKGIVTLIMPEGEASTGMENDVAVSTPTSSSGPSLVQAAFPPALSDPAAAASATAMDDNPNDNSKVSSEESNAWKYSPVPLRKDEAENAEIRALAAKLAPTLEKADALFVVPNEFRSRLEDGGAAAADAANRGDDDSIDEEVEALRYSELALRQELELASDFSNLFNRMSPPSRQPQQKEYEDGTQDDEDDNKNEGERTSVAPHQRGNQQRAVSLVPRRLDSSELEADVDPDDESDTPEQKQHQHQRGASAAKPPRTKQPHVEVGLKGSVASLSPDSMLSPIRLPYNNNNTRTPDTGGNKSSIQSNASSKKTGSSSSKLHEILIPAIASPKQVLPSSSTAGASTPDASIAEPSANDVRSRPYTQTEHFAHLGLGQEDETWYSIDWTKSLLSSSALDLSASDAPQTPSRDDGVSAASPAAASAAASLSAAVSGVMREFCLTLPDAKLRTVFVGLPEHHPRAALGAPGAMAVATAAPSVPLSPPLNLPVRTITIRVRGDVLCGAIMDAVVHALVPAFKSSEAADDTADTIELSTTTNTAAEAATTAASASSSAGATTSPVHIQKRQGGHLQAIVGGTKLSTVRRRRAESVGMEDDVSLSREEEETLVTDTTTKTSPPFFIDVQLVTQKSEHCERVLLVRVHHLRDPGSYQYDLAVEEDDNGINNNGQEAGGDQSDDGIPADSVLVDADEATQDLRQCLQLREACALIQRVESPRKAKRIRVPPGKLAKRAAASPTRDVLQETVSDHLLRHYQACPSVKDGNITLPSLNPQDWPVLVASWPWIKSIWNELESRDLTYHTLRTSRFGDFPALPTLDVHYCSQIRRLSREDMVVQLLKSASELEDYAREAEYACANMISLLQPTFDTYGVEPPALPRPTPLTSYPLDFVAPQQTCPPWGQLVMEAMNQIQAWTKDNDDALASSVWDPASSLSHAEAAESFAMAERAVLLVLSAFQKQDDEEKGARLGRKNMQVMDRLAKMQEHERKSVVLLHQSDATCIKARKAADDFASKTGGVREVPLLKWSIVVGGATGSCLVTANHVLFVTQLIPYIGGSKATLFRLQDVDFAVQDAGTPSLLNPLPTSISVKRGGDEVYSFRPSSGGARLKRFLDLLQSINIEA
jgi:hypothetical protein